MHTLYSNKQYIKCLSRQKPLTWDRFGSNKWVFQSVQCSVSSSSDGDEAIVAHISVFQEPFLHHPIWNELWISTKTELKIRLNSLAVLKEWKSSVKNVQNRTRSHTTTSWCCHGVRSVSKMWADQSGRPVIIKLKAEHMAMLYQPGKWSVICGQFSRDPLSTVLCSDRDVQIKTLNFQRKMHVADHTDMPSVIAISWSCHPDHHTSMGQMLAFDEISYQPIVVIHLIWWRFLPDHIYMKYDLELIAHDLLNPSCLCVKFILDSSQ